MMPLTLGPTIVATPAALAGQPPMPIGGFHPRRSMAPTHSGQARVSKSQKSMPALRIFRAIEVQSPSERVSGSITTTSAPNSAQDSLKYVGVGRPSKKPVS